MADDRVLIDATNATFWQITQYKPGKRLVMSDPKDRAMSKAWLDIYAQIKSRRDRATQLARQVLIETATPSTVTPHILIVEQRDGSLTHQLFPSRGNLDVQYNWVIDQPELYTYLAAFDFTKDEKAPIYDQFAITKRRQQVPVSGWCRW